MNLIPLSELSDEHALQLAKWNVNVEYNIKHFMNGATRCESLGGDWIVIINSHISDTDPLIIVKFKGIIQNIGHGIIISTYTKLKNWGYDCNGY